MIVKKFIVKDMNEAMKWIKLELGSEAVILDNKKYRKPGLKGFFSKRKLEVTAAIEEGKFKNASNTLNEEKDEKLANSIEDLKKLLKEQNEKEAYLKNNINLSSNKINEDNKNEDESDSFSKKDIINKTEENNIDDYKKQNNDGVINEIRSISYPEFNYNDEANLIYSENIRNYNNIKNEIAISLKEIDDDDSESNDNSIKENPTIPKEIINEIREMKSLLNTAIKPNSSYKSLFLEKMSDLDIDKKYHDEIYTYCVNENEEIDEEKFKEKILGDVQINFEELKGVIALIGPTGVGKTTTISKLAGQLLTKEEKTVGLITLDVYRIGAVQQLKEYATIMNIPFKTVLTMQEMEDAVKELSYLDVILIDTIGRSSKDQISISQLRAFIKKAEAKKTILVMSSTTKNKDIPMIINGYSSLNYDSTIVTKLDETATYGSLYTILKESKVPISYVTFGQTVPNDISKFEESFLTDLILGKETIK